MTIALIVAAMMLGQSPGSPRTVDQGARSMIQTRRDVVVRSNAEWAALREEHYAGPELAPVDFSREMVVGVFLGSKPTAGWGVTIVSAAEEGAVLRVRYRETAPPPGSISAQVITVAYALVAIPTSAAKEV